jgi:hypothetical protein
MIFMVKRIFFYTFLIIESLLGILKAQDQLFIHAQLRPRTEYRNGYSRLPSVDDKPAYFINQRSRLYIHSHISQFRLLFAIQDVRVWGDANIYNSTGVAGSEASIDLYQANLEWLISTKTSLQIGRQILAYDDERLIGGRDWNQHGLAYDALVLKSNIKQWDAHLGLSLNNNMENKYGNLYDQAKMKTLNYLHLQKSLKNKGYLSFIAIGSGYTASDTSEVIYMRGTTGGNLLVKQPPFEYSCSGYYQFGRNKNGVLVQAYLLTAATNWSYKNFSTGVGIVYMSGNNENNNDSKDRQFDILYGGRHRYYGLMDYFNDVAKATDSRGLTDTWLQVSYKITTNFSLRADFHYFTLQDNEPIYSNFLGNELDLMFRQQFAPELRITGGFSVFKSTPYFRSMQSSNISERTPCWVWVMLDFSPVLFKSDKN